MTKKDYIKIASMFKNLLETCPEYKDGVHLSIGAISEVFAQDNPNFDRNKFIWACGIKEIRI